jgi:alpha-beta hydrolase superfamily lysophospholipase
MLVDLVQTTSRDGVRLDGAYQAADSPGASGWPVDALVLVHGTGGNFYSSTLLEALAERFLGNGVAVLRANTRGHDLMCNVSTTRGGKRLGAAYEVADDCRHDLLAWAGWLKARVGPRVGLVGHSLGAVKCLYAQALEPELRAACAVAISPPRLSYSWFRSSDRAAEFLETFGRAERLVQAGEPEALLEVRLLLPMVITAGGYVEKYGPDERYNWARFLSKVTCPVLLTFGAVEAATNMAFRDSAAAVKEAAPLAHVEVVPDADHFYTGLRDELARRVEAWLGLTPPSPPAAGPA